MILTKPPKNTLDDLLSYKKVIAGIDLIHNPNEIHNVTFFNQENKLF
jgi:hypothetical protein